MVEIEIRNGGRSVVSVKVEGGVLWAEAASAGKAAEIMLAGRMGAKRLSAEDRAALAEIVAGEAADEAFLDAWEAAWRASGSKEVADAAAEAAYVAARKVG